MAYPKRHYGFGHLLFDVVMVIITHGFWLIVPVLKFLRRNS